MEKEFYERFIKNRPHLSKEDFDILKEILGATKYNKIIKLVNPEFLKEKNIKTTKK